VKKTENEDTYFRRYKRFIEHLYDTSRCYRDLVYLSKLVRMFIYIATGASILAVVLFNYPMATFEDIVQWLTKNSVGRLFAILIAFCLIIYGIEKPR